LVPQPNGGALKAGGTPGNRGGTGRPPNAFKDFMRRVSDSPEAREHFERVILLGPYGKDGSDFWEAFKLAAAYGYGKPEQVRVIAGDAERPISMGVIHKFPPPK
jgi:hypothetical protein